MAKKIIKKKNTYKHNIKTSQNELTKNTRSAWELQDNLRKSLIILQKI